METGLRFGRTQPHVCGYFSDRVAQSVVVMPDSPALSALYENGLECGFRRSGPMLYAPRCPDCRACIASRVPVAEFRPNRSQRRCAARNRDLGVRLVPAAYGEEHFALYRRYLDARHPDGGMDTGAPADFARFLFADWSPTHLLEFRLEGRLLAVAVTDVCVHSLSAVYTFYDPEHPARGLGTFAVLSQIELARQRGAEHLYLGFWIPDHPKMGYKARFRPIEILLDHAWRPMEEGTHAPSAYPG